MDWRNDAAFLELDALIREAIEEELRETYDSGWVHGYSAGWEEGYYGDDV